MSKPEHLQAFKRECRNYIYYENRVRALSDRITLLDMRMQGVYSPVLDKIGSSPSRHELDLELIIQQKDGLKKEKKYYEDKIQWVKNAIEAIPSPAYRSLIWLTYVESEQLQGIADDFGVSRQHIYKMRKKFLESVLTDERMEALQEIDESFAQDGYEDERVK